LKATSKELEAQQSQTSVALEEIVEPRAQPYVPNCYVNYKKKPGASQQDWVREVHRVTWLGMLT
jgi:hypothetical protein